MISLKYTITDDFHYYDENYLWFSSTEEELLTHIDNFLKEHLIKLNQESGKKKPITISDIYNKSINFHGESMKVYDLVNPALYTLEERKQEKLLEIKNSLLNFKLQNSYAESNFEKNNSIESIQKNKFYYIQRQDISCPYYNFESFYFFYIENIEEELLNLEIFLEDLKKENVRDFYISGVNFEVDYFFNEYGYYKDYNPFFSIIDFDDQKSIDDFFGSHESFAIKIWEAKINVFAFSLYLSIAGLDYNIALYYIYPLTLFAASLLLTFPT